MNPLTLKTYAIYEYEDENLNGFFCRLHLAEKCLTYTDEDLATFCNCSPLESCNCKDILAEDEMRREIWSAESNFVLWKQKVCQFVEKFCPKHAYGDKYYDNDLDISINFYVRHKPWFEKWTQVGSMDGLRLLLLRAGDVEQNPGPQVYLRNASEIALLRKIEALERARQRQQEKNKTLVRKLRQVRKENRYHFQMDREDIIKLVKSPSIQRAAAYAATNFVLPGAGTAAATVVEGSKVIDATNKVKDAAESLANTCMDQIPELIATHTNLADIATATLSNINNLTSRLQQENGLLSTINKFVRNLTSQVSTMGLIITLILCMATLAWDWKIGCAVIMLALVYFNWPREVTEKIRQLLGRAGWKFEMSGASCVPLVGQICFTLLAFFGVSKIPTDRFYDSLLKRLDVVPKAFAGISKIWDQAGKMFELVSDEFRIYFLGEKREDLMQEKGIADEVDKWVTRVKYYLDAKQRNLLARDEASVREVEELFTKMYRWKHTPVQWKAMPSECQRIITSITPLVNDLFKFACRSTVHEGGPRKAPLAVFLSGDSGRGKSELLYPLAFSLLANRKYNMVNARNEIYVRNYETDYWDGYVGQKITFFDDAFQMRDSPGNPSPEFMEAIRLINTAPAHVHCADLNDKGRFFSSEICIYTTNLKEKFGSYINSVNCPEAAIRRLNANAYRIKTNPKFEKEVIINGTIERRLDPKLIKNCEECEELRIRKGLEARLKFCPHVQLFDKYDLMTDEILENDMSYKDLVKQLKEYDAELVNSEGEKLYMYEKLIEDPYIFEMNDESEFQDAEDSLQAGAIDFTSATDVIAYNTLRNYITYLTQPLPQGCGMIDIDRIHSEISAHPDLWATFKRLNEHGIRRRETTNDSLQIAMDAHDIHYDHEARMYYSRQNVWYSFGNVFKSFKKYVARLGDQLTFIWENSGFVETLNFICIGVVLMGWSVFIYNGISACKCPVCKQNGDYCECIRVVDEGYLYQGEIYSFDEYSLESHDKKNFRVESDIKPLIKQQQAMRIESDIKPLNKQQQAMHIESDVKPLNKQQQNMRIESDVKPLNNQQKQMRIESDVRPLVKGTQNMKIEILEEEESLHVEMYQDQGCEMLESKIVNRSLYLLHDDHKPYGNVLFLKGTVFLINYHFIEILKQTKSRNHVFYLSNRSSKLVEFTFGSMLDNHVRLEKNGEPLDAALVWLCPKEDRVSPHTNLTHLFIKTEDLAMLNGSYNAQLPTFNSQPHDVCVSKRSLYDVRMSHNKVRVSDQNIVMEINHSWQYGGSTSSGDCGAPVILNHNSAIRKIVGIHMASNAHIGMAQTITQEILQDGFKNIDQRFQCHVEIDIPCVPIMGEDNVCGSVPLDKGLMVHGRTDVPLSSGNNSKIIPSPFFDYVPHKTIPAKLRPFNGVDPMYNGLVKYGKSVPRIEPKYIEIAVNDVKNNFTLNECHKDMCNYQRVLTYEEAILGVPEDEFLAPINRSTSMGYPYTMVNEKLRGKRDAFGEDEWDLNSPLALQVKSDVEKLIENCRQGIQTGVYWSDTLKDERRPIAKVEAGKTRVFCGGPVHFTIAFRKYFLGFAAWMMHNRNANEVSVGTNVYSPDWNDIVRKLASRAASKLGVKVVAGDFANFDGSLSSQILWAILDAINEWYDDGKENAQIRHTLWMHIVHAIHINRDVIYQATHSQPSGCPITAILNSIYNSIIIRIAYIICAQQHFEQTGEDYRSMKWFNIFVSMVSYGDDNLIGINEKILTWFNQISITSALLVIGHEYTDEAKTGLIVPVRDITEVAYLKRHFKWNPALNRYVAPLDLDTVLEIVQWTKKGLSSDAITLANLDVTMRELSLHDCDVFEKYKKILSQECVKHKIFYRFLTQNEYIAHVCDEPLFLEIQNDYSLVKTNKKMARNYILMDKYAKTLYVNEYDEDVLKRKLALFCYYRRINVRYVSGVPEDLLTFCYHF
jgi:hypothetical protein